MHFSHIFVISIFLNLLKYSKEEITKTEIKNFTTEIITWNKAKEYIYYINISDYNVGDENVLQILNEDREILKNLMISEIDESILSNNNEDIKILNNLTNQLLKKYRTKTKQYYYEIIFKKREGQNNFVIYINPNLEINKTQVNFYLSKPIEQYNLYRENIDNENIFVETFNMDSNIETFFKFNIRNISLSNANIVFFVDNKLVSTFYKDYISLDEIKDRIFILEKNSTNELNHSIYLSLLGEMKKIKIQIVLDYHDIKYYYKSTEERNSFYIEKINCKNDLYIFETNNCILEPSYHLQITPFYGDYKLIYYDNILTTKISDIFIPSNEVIVTEKIKKIKTKFNILRLSCKTPTFLRIQYLKEYSIKNVTEGIEIISYMSFNRYEDNYILADDPSKKYKFYFGINGESESNNKIIKVNLFMKNLPMTFLTNDQNQTQYSNEAIFDIFYDKSFKKNIYEFQTHSDVYLKTYLISNQYYKNIVSGLTEITSETKAIAFKVRKDIIFDFFIMKLYSDDPIKNISCSYELKIVESKYIEKGKVMVGFNEIGKFQKNNIFLKFSNPYNKFDSKIKNEDYVFLLISFNNTNEDYYPVYTDIRYYYNDQIINIEESKPNILLSQKEYQIFGDSNNHEKNKVLLNINKCNITKDYYIKLL